MKRNIIFYSLEFEKHSQLNLLEDNDITLSQAVENSSKSMKAYEKVYRKNNYIIEIQTINGNHIFGSYGNLSQVNPINTLRGRNIEDLTEEEIKDLIEKYTYFYLDLDSNNLVLLYDSQVRNFEKNFSEFLLNQFRLTNIFKEIKIVQWFNENIEQNLGRHSHLTKVSVEYKSNSLPTNAFASIDEISDINNNSIRNAKISLSLDPTVSNQHFIKKVTNFLGKGEKYQQFKIDDEDEHTIDVISKTIVKKIKVEMNEEMFDDLEEIKNLLKTNLNEQVDIM